MEDAERLAFYARVIRGAGYSTFEAKLRALARVLKEGLDEDGSVHEAMILAVILDDLEPPHTLVLRHLRDTAKPPKELRRPNSQNPQGWEISDLEQADPMAAGVVEAIVAVLARHGLIRDVGGVTTPSMSVPPCTSWRHWASVACTSLGVPAARHAE